MMERNCSWLFALCASRWSLMQLEANTPRFLGTITIHDGIRANIVLGLRYPTSLSHESKLPIFFSRRRSTVARDVGE